MLSVLAGIHIAGLYACLAASLWHFGRRKKAEAAKLPMSLIRPVRGLDEILVENAACIVASDTEGQLDVHFAVESESDEAVPKLRALARSHPSRMIEVLITGPSGPRMGKMHNMIEAFPKTRHPYVIFSDADVRVTPELIAETGRAFKEGCDAAFALPCHESSPGLGGWAFLFAFNHCFCLPAALNYLLFPLQFCAGAWMAYTKEILDKGGGLERFSRAMADDFALSRAARSAGGKLCLLKEPAHVYESGQSFPQALRRIAKWAVIIRSNLPWAYALFPLVSPGFVAALLLICARTDSGRGLALTLIASRVFVGVVQDAVMARRFMAWWGYALMPAGDVGAVLLWLAGLRSDIEWRGKRYRVGPGGEARVL